jgi:DNA adenine methylase
MNLPLKWHGGKSYLAEWIISHFPKNYTHYTEPYFGGGSVLLHTTGEGVSETVNDVNSELTNFWQVLRETPDRMLRALWGMPFSEDEWYKAQTYEGTDNVRRATAFFVKYRQSRQGLGKSYATPTKRVRRGMNENVSAWLSAIECLPEVHERLKRVEIRSMDAIKFIQMYDHLNAFHYCDPPYLHSTRTATDAYEFEMDEKQHVQLLECLSKISGKFLLSGYPSSLYNTFAESHGWKCSVKEIDNKASSSKVKEKKHECLWSNY